MTDCITATGVLYTYIVSGVTVLFGPLVAGAEWVSGLIGGESFYSRGLEIGGGAGGAVAVVGQVSSIIPVDFLGLIGVVLVVLFARPTRDAL